MTMLYVCNAHKLLRFQSKYSTRDIHATMVLETDTYATILFLETTNKNTPTRTNSKKFFPKLVLQRIGPENSATYASSTSHGSLTANDLKRCRDNKMSKE